MKKELKTKITNVLRTSILVALMITLTFLCVIKLMKIQIVDAGIYSEKAKNTYTASQTIIAARGQIVDSEGRALNTNEIVYKIIAQRAFLPTDGENDIIAGVINVLVKHGEEWIDTAPITMDAPFKFKNVSDDQLDAFKERLGLNYDATVENCLKAFADNFGIDTDKYDEQMIRYIGGIRYEMILRDFSFQNRYTLAEDVSMEAIIELKEKTMIFKGIDVVEEPIRVYLDGTSIPHIRGRINSINEQQYSVLKDSGYNLNDVIGFFGIEESMESTLRGENGIREITRDTTGAVVSDEITKEVQAGKTVKLTIDTEFQSTVEEILSNHINWLNNKTSDSRGIDCYAGSAVVLDVKTGAILAMVNNPSYDLNDYVDLMLAEDAGEPIYENKPLLDRSAAQGYRPGSAFKTITATAGLINSVVTRHDTVYCGQVYTYYDDYQPKCTGFHGSISTVMALRWSCNIYFYDVGRRLGIDRLSEAAMSLFGVGTDLNCDIYNYTGRMTTAEVYEELLGSPLTSGDTIQAAIGQSETLLTPLHMATVAMTLANDGVRYRPYLVDSVWNYDLTELIYETVPEVVADWSEGNEDSFATVREGMVELAKGVNWPLYSSSNHFEYLPDYPAFKTGTPELVNNKYNSTVLGYYPANDPQIAFAIVLEEGEYSRYMVRNIIDAYFYGSYEADYNEDGNVANPWKRWDGTRTAIR